MTDILEEVKKLQDENEELKDENETLKSQLDSTDEDCNTSRVPFAVGKKYYIRTVTYHCTGKVKRITGGFLVLSDAAWIADSGRFREAIMDGVLNEVEPVDVDMFVNINSITDAFVWNHKLPREQK